MINGFSLCVDILDFSEFIKCFAQEGATNKINDWVSVVEKLVKKFNLSSYQLISDTLFVGVQNTPENLNKLINFSKDLLNESILNAIPPYGEEFR